MIGMAGALFGVSSYAASLDFVLGAGSSATVDDSSINRGSVAAVVNPDLDGMAFSLAPGESKEVSFFDLVFDCEKVACGGKTTLSATLDFASPDSSASGSGKRAGGSLLGVLTGGMVQWTQPSIISTALGDFSVVFEDLFGRRTGSALTVRATITALEGTGSGIASVSAVPLPPAVWLFLTALLTLAGFNSRKRRGRPPLPAH
jgi:hypothetical protein